MATKINQNKKIIIRTGFKKRRVLPGLVKKYLKIIHHARTEKSHIKHAFNDKPLSKGLSEYIQFMQRRIKYKFYA